MLTITDGSHNSGYFSISSEYGDGVEIKADGLLYFKTNSVTRFAIGTDGNGTFFNTLVGGGFRSPNYNANGDAAAFGGTLSTASSIETGNPSGSTSDAWKFGTAVEGVCVLNTGVYLTVDLNGTPYKLAICN